MKISSILNFGITVYLTTSYVFKIELEVEFLFEKIRLGALSVDLVQFFCNAVKFRIANAQS